MRTNRSKEWPGFGRTGTFNHNLAIALLMAIALTPTLAMAWVPTTCTGKARIEKACALAKASTVKLSVVEGACKNGCMEDADRDACTKAVAANCAAGGSTPITPTEVTCPDGSRAPNPAACPPVRRPPPLASVNCFDGSTAPNSAGCPACPLNSSGNGARCTCDPGFTLSGRSCVSETLIVEEKTETCLDGTVMPEGKCPRIVCPDDKSRRIRKENCPKADPCPDGRVVFVGEVCPPVTTEVACPDGTTKAQKLEDCPTVTCATDPKKVVYKGRESDCPPATTATAPAAKPPAPTCAPNAHAKGSECVCDDWFIADEAACRGLTHGEAVNRCKAGDHPVKRLLAAAVPGKDGKVATPPVEGWVCEPDLPWWEAVAAVGGWLFLLFLIALIVAIKKGWLKPPKPAAPAPAPKPAGPAPSSAATPRAPATTAPATPVARAAAAPPVAERREAEPAPGERPAGKAAAPPETRKLPRPGE